MRLRPTHLLVAWTVVIAAAGFLWLRSSRSAPTLTESARLEARVPSALHGGGFERATGGTLTASTSDYGGADLFAPSPARSRTGALHHPDAYPSAQTCARCHGAIHDAWSSSMHAVAATDPWYLRVKDLLAFEQGEQAVRECAGCHAPIALMTGEVGLYGRESATSSEGVSCVFCHTLASTEGPGGAWVSDPARVRDYLGGDYLAAEGIEAAAHVLMAAPAAHKGDMMIPLYEDSAACMSCHEFEKDGVPLQSTYSEWQASSYAAEGITCQGCHFTPGAGPTVLDPGRVVDAYSAREHMFRHTLGGGSTEVAPRGTDNHGVLRDAVTLEARVEGGTLVVSVANTGAGHHVPTGVGDLRQMWLEVTAQDAAGRETLTSGVMDAAGFVPEDAVVFRQVFGDAGGRPLVRHDIWRAAQVLEDTRIPAGEARESTFELPADTTSVQVRLLWRDAPAEFAQRVLKRPAESIPVVELARWEGQW